jgi:hypothetical protein
MDKQPTKPLESLPRKGLIADFSGVGLNEPIEVYRTMSLMYRPIWELQKREIHRRAKELDAELVILTQRGRPDKPDADYIHFKPRNSSPITHN